MIRGILLFLLVISLIVWWTTTFDISRQVQPPADEGADYLVLFINDFEITRMDDDGLPRYKIEGDRLETYRRNKNVSIIKSPILNLLQQDAWRVTARQAVHNSKTDMARFIGDVVMQQTGREPAVTIHTQKIVFDMTKQIARTDKPVKIIQGQSELNATGMLYNNTTKIMKLSSQVSGFYQPGTDRGDLTK